MVCVWLCGGLFKWVCLCGLSVYVCVMTFFHNYVKMTAKCPVNKGMRQETFLEKVFHRSNQDAGERKLIKI